MTMRVALCVFVVALLVQGSTAQLTPGLDLAGLGTWAPLLTSGFNNLVHHDIVVGAAPFLKNRAPLLRNNAAAGLEQKRSYWDIFNLPAAQQNPNPSLNGFAPIYATVGDRLVFHHRGFINNFAVRSVPTLAAWNACNNLAGGTRYAEVGAGIRAITQGSVQPTGARIPQVDLSASLAPTSPVVFNYMTIVELRTQGDQFFIDDGAAANCLTGRLRLKVSVDTGTVPTWDVADRTKDLRNHQWVVGGANGWTSLESFNGAFAYAPIWAAQGDYIGFHYGPDSDVWQFESKFWFDQCNFYLASSVGSSDEGCNTVDTMARPCKAYWAMGNRVNVEMDTTGAHYFASQASPMFSGSAKTTDMGFQNNARLGFQLALNGDEAAKNSFQFQYWACSAGRQKVEVHVYSSTQQPAVTTCSAFTSQLYFGLFGGSSAQSLISGLFNFNEDCFDQYAYLLSSQYIYTSPLPSGGPDPNLAGNPQNTAGAGLGGLGSLGTLALLGGGGLGGL